MSKAFVKDDAPEEELVLTKIDLMEGRQNYMTRSGFEHLQKDLESLTKKLATLPADSLESRRDLDLQIQSLQQTLDSVKVISPKDHYDRVLFGAKVTVRTENENLRVYQIVGVDEANAKFDKVSWISPIASALLQKEVGDVVTLRTPQGEEDLEIVKIE